MALNSAIMAVDTSSGRIVLGRAHEFLRLPGLRNSNQRMDRERLLSALIAAHPSGLRNYIAQWDLVFDARRPADHEVVDLVRAALRSGHLRIALLVPASEAPATSGSHSLSLPMGIGGSARTPFGGVGMKGEITGLGATVKDGQTRAQPFLAASGSVELGPVSGELSAHTETGLSAYAGYSAAKTSLYTSDEAVIYSVGFDACLGLCIGFSLERKLTTTEIEDSYMATLAWRYSRSTSRPRQPSKALKAPEQCTPENPTGKELPEAEPIRLHMR